MTEVLRTPNDGCFELKTNSWGTYLTAARDPDATVIITDEQLEGFELRDDIQKIPADLWQRWINLCLYYTKHNTGSLEVSCRILRNEEDRSKYRILVPQQVVTGASVRVDSFDKSVDIETGEVIEMYPPQGWRVAGSSHNHGIIDAFFSGTDDKYELLDTGIHLVIGDVDVHDNSYKCQGSITASGRRFLIDFDKLVDATPVDDVTYHPSVVDIVKITGLRSNDLPVYSIGFDRIWNDNWNETAHTTVASATQKVDLKRVNDEMNDVHSMVQQLIQACKSKGVDPSEALTELAFAIDDLASENAAFADPFYWSGG